MADPVSQQQQQPQPPPNPDAREKRAQFGRKIIVAALLALIVGGQAIAVATSEEYWPFSPYPMYSGLVETGDYTVIQLIAVTNDGRELALNAVWLRKWMNRLSRRDNPREELERAMVKYVRKDGWHRPGDSKKSPPKLKALRAYEQHWTLKGDAANATKPDSSKLLAEIRRSANGGIDGY